MIKWYFPIIFRNLLNFKMTVKCGKSYNLFMKTRHECINEALSCAAEKVKIHQIDFAAAPKRNTYYMDTHPFDGTSRAMYHKDKNHKDFKKVAHIEKKTFDSSKYGQAWYMDKVNCKEDECPYFVRAAGDLNRGSLLQKL